MMLYYLLKRWEGGVEELWLGNSGSRALHVVSLVFKLLSQQMS
jgi:hypothetical protein